MRHYFLYWFKGSVDWAQGRAWHGCYGDSLMFGRKFALHLFLLQSLSNDFYYHYVVTKFEFKYIIPWLNGVNSLHESCSTILGRIETEKHQQSYSRK